ncbi:MAG: hypothetical protein HUU38_01400 [Anaerolineales bacterium]|nr:hypothetical protein [Anaerolineales bacterium]
MLNRLRERLTDLLAHQNVCIFSANEPGGASGGGVWAVPVRYHSHGLAVDCLVPRWADASFYLEQNPQVLLIIRSSDGVPLRWLQYRGRAHILPAPDWPELLPKEDAQTPPETRYLAVRIQPTRIDLIDEAKGWGVLESLEF